MKSTKYVSPKDKAYREMLATLKRIEDEWRKDNWGYDLDFLFDPNFYDKFFTEPKRK